MSDETQNAEATATETDSHAIETLQDVEKRYFPPEEVGTTGAEYFLACKEVAGANFLSNFEMEEDFPENFGLAIIPVSERSNEGNKVVSVIASAVPTTEAIFNAENGKAFVDEMIQNALMTKVANAGRPKAGQVGVPVLPKTLADFMEGGRRETLKGFQDVAPFFVKLLRKQGMKGFSVVQFRECLQSTATAKQYYPGISQEMWIKLANGVVARGEAKKLDMTPVKQWIKTRDEAGARRVDDDMLAGLLDDIDGGENDESEAAE